jgi:uncharacterized YigZ family protein
VASTLRESLVHHAEPIKGSRFRATVVPVDSAATASEALARIQAADPDATHHCWAWRLGPDDARCSDDGEPSGSAGKPILARLEGHDWIGVLAVVTRWYGGTKLGVGGLIRAYGRTAGDALALAEPVPYVALTRWSLTCSYADQGAVTGVLETHNAETLDATYAADVTLRIQVPTATASALRTALNDATAGRVRVP